MDLLVATEAMNLIRDKFRILLTAGGQVRELPPALRAAGQHLNQYESPQRGLFGTAAAIRVMGDRLGHDGDELLLGALIRYVGVRPEVENSLSAGTDTEGTGHRLAVEANDTFKTADVVYSLARVARLSAGRESVLGVLVERLESGRLSEGGWAADLAATGLPDLLATAHAIRALNAAGRPVSSQDVRLLERCISAGEVSDYVATFVLLVVLTLKREQLTQRERRWVNELGRRLWSEMGSLSEANYDYRIGARNYYVRVPWQVYLLFCALIAQPATRFLSGRKQSLILGIVAALATPGGFVYPLSGSTPSTRTYAVLYDFFDEARSAFIRIPQLKVSSRIANSTFRLVHSRSAGVVVGLGSVVFIGAAVYLWLDSGSASLADVAANFVAAAVLAMAGVAHRRWRR